MNGQMDIFDFLNPEPVERFTEKTCAATLKKCDCYCGYEKCCQRCTEKCTHRCGYSLERFEIYKKFSEIGGHK